MRVIPLVAVLLLAGSAQGAEPEAGARAWNTVRLVAAQGPRPAGERTDAEAYAAKLVVRRLRALGYRVTVQWFTVPDGPTLNVVGWTAGAPRVVLVAHLDGVRDSPAANDNASGVAVLLELAEALRGRPGVLLAATGAEERVVTGSPVHLGALRLLRGMSLRARRGVRLAVALDMVGVGRRLHVRGLEATPNRSARLLLAQGGASYLRDDGDSDHAELTRHGVRAAWVQWRPDACWHRACDVARRVDPRRLQAAYALVRRAALAALESS